MESGERHILGREAILGARDFKIEAVEVPEWGGTVYVRSLKGSERDQYEGSRVRMRDNKVEMIFENTRANLVSKTLCDAQGTLLFTFEDIEALGEKSASALDRVFEVASRLSALRPADVEQKIKNSVAVLTNSSGIS